jgi:hypothetical protein
VNWVILAAFAPTRASSIHIYSSSLGSKVVDATAIRGLELDLLWHVEGILVYQLLNIGIQTDFLAEATIFPMSNVQGYAHWGVQPDSETRRGSGGRSTPALSLRSHWFSTSIHQHFCCGQAATTETGLRYGKKMGILGSRFWHYRHA